MDHVKRYHLSNNLKEWPILVLENNVFIVEVLENVFIVEVLGNQHLEKETEREVTM